MILVVWPLFGEASAVVAIDLRYLMRQARLSGVIGRDNVIHIFSMIKLICKGGLQMIVKNSVVKHYTFGEVYSCRMRK